MLARVPMYWRTMKRSKKQFLWLVIMTNSSNGEGTYKELLVTLLKNTFTPIEWEECTPYNANL
jgi:hypothetical protein